MCVRVVFRAFHCRWIRIHWKILTTSQAFPLSSSTWNPVSPQMNRLLINDHLCHQKKIWKLEASLRETKDTKTLHSFIHLLWKMILYYYLNSSRPITPGALSRWPWTRHWYICILTWPLPCCSCSAIYWTDCFFKCSALLLVMSEMKLWVIWSAR